MIDGEGTERRDPENSGGGSEDVTSRSASFCQLRHAEVDFAHLLCQLQAFFAQFIYRRDSTFIVEVICAPFALSRLPYDVLAGNLSSMTSSARSTKSNRRQSEKKNRKVTLYFMAL